jgi:hypothetical protein
MPAKLRVVGSAETSEMRSVASKGRKVNLEYRVREHLTEAEVDNNRRPLNFIPPLSDTSITNTVRYTAMSPEPFKDIWRRAF